MTNNVMEKKVLWLTNIPSPYRVDFFEELGKNVNLTVIFEKAGSKERDTSWHHSNFKNFKGIVLKGIEISADTAFDFRIYKYIKNVKTYDYIIVSNPLTLMGMYCVRYFKAHGILFLIETDGGFAKTGKTIRERLKQYIISSSDGWLSTARIHDEYYIHYGADKNKIYRYPFTSVKRKDVLLQPIDKLGKELLKRQLGIAQKHMILAVGQFIYRKGFDLLLNISRNLGSDTAVVILGGIPTKEYKDIIKNKKLENVYFPGFIEKNHIQKYYCAADIFVFPTRKDVWGLVVNEAIATGLPVVTTQKCIAGTELVRNGVNGFLIPNDDEDELFKSIISILGNDAIRENMGIESLKIAHEYTIEKMAEWHLKFFADRKD